MNTQPAAMKPVLYDEASLRSFVVGTPAMNVTRAADSLGIILEGASKDSVLFRKTVSFLSEPFGSPNSSYRNQHLYAKILEAKINSTWFIEAEKEIAREKLMLSRQNNLGHKANDFPYTTPGGAMKQMHHLKVNFLLLYFNNPECEACKEMKAALMQSAIINQKIQDGDLTILSIYMGTDKTTWRSHVREYPKQWLQGIGEDATLYKAKIYDLNAIPTMYLLDKDKTILLKDYFTVKEIEQLVN